METIKIEDLLRNIEINQEGREGDKSERRTGLDRRDFLFTAYGPERRKGVDRRKYKGRRQKPRTQNN